MRKAAVFFLMILVMAVFTGIFLYSQSKGIQIVTKEGKIVPLYEDSYALVIGVGKYTKGWQNLESIPKEIDEVETALKKHGFKVEKVSNPTYDQLKQAFDRFIDEYGFTPNNRLLFFFSGHGYSRRGGKKGYIVPSDAPNPVYDEHGFLQKSIEMEQVITWARRIEAKHALFLFDSCFSGLIFKSKDTPVPRHISYLTANDVRQFISAGSAREKLPAKSVFTPTFVRGINGEADLDKDGYVTGTELGVYLQEKVLKYNKGQTPQYGKIRDPDLDEGDFVFVSQKVFEPPAVLPPIDYSDLENEAKWSKWQTNFQNEVNKLNEYDKNSGILADSKVRAWKNMLQAYFQNNPYSEKDEQLRNYAKERIRYWENRVEDKSGDNTPPSASNDKSGDNTPPSASNDKSGDNTPPSASDDKLAEVKAIESRAKRVYKNDKGFWEAEYEDGIVLVYIPPGEFTMGSSDESDDEKPSHPVYLDGYWMGKTEVTFEQYDKYCDDTSLKQLDPNGWGRKKRPVNNISWNDAEAYCKWLSKKIGFRFKLPTEAQWEKAARGTDSRRYPWGNQEPDETLANFALKVGKTTQVGSYPQGASPYGILNMAGNVWEWCNDWYGNDYYKMSPDKNPLGPTGSTCRVIRGGSWINYSRSLRCADRYYGKPSYRNSVLGFRLSQEN
jgi:formylglycine-generating enzyme required for sulfatase activity